MKPLARILAATDLSAPARHAVERALQIAAASGARCDVLHALKLDALDALREWLGEDLARVRNALENQARETLEELLAGTPGTALLVAGAPLAAIIERADALDAELLVLGARGEGFLRHLLLGATASRLLRKATRFPVLVVKQAPRGPYRRLLIAVDFSPVSATLIRFARRVAPAADIVLLHAFEVPFEGKLHYAGVEEDVIGHYRRAARDDALRRLRETADAAGLAIGDYTPLAVHDDPSRQAILQEHERDCDLIVIGKHGTHVTEDLLLGSVTKHVLAESQSDVLVVVDARMPPNAER